MVLLASLSGVMGSDENDKVLWQVQSFADRRGRLGLEGKACIQAAIEPVP